MEYQPKTKKKKPNPKNGYQLRMNASFGEDAITAMREPPTNGANARERLLKVPANPFTTPRDSLGAALLTIKDMPPIMIGPKDPRIIPKETTMAHAPGLETRAMELAME